MTSHNLKIYRHLLGGQAEPDSSLVGRPDWSERSIAVVLFECPKAKHGHTPQTVYCLPL